MSKSLTKATDAWREYTTGLNGSPALKSVYEGEGWSWRGREAERKYWKRRESLLLEIEALASRLGQPEEAIALNIDRQLQDKEITLHQLAEQCKHKDFI